MIAFKFEYGKNPDNKLWWCCTYYEGMGMIDTEYQTDMTYNEVMSYKKELKYESPDIEVIKI